MSCRGKEVGDALVNGVVHAARRTVEIAFKDFLCVFRFNAECKVSFADRAAEDIHERASHFRSSLMSTIWVISGPVDIRVTGLPISSSACLMKSLAFLVSFL